MSAHALPIIAGAGPTGKGAALFLARAGIAARIIDIAPEPSRQSKALAVNPRTLEVLEPTGVTEQMLAIGLKIRKACLRSGGKIVAELRFDQLSPKFPFMLALSQAVTERLLGEALAKLGRHVERGIGLATCINSADGVQADLQNQATGATERITCPWLLAADGAHSAARRSLGVHFTGSNFDSPWYLADLPLRTSLEADTAHVIFVPGGFVFAIRVVSDDSPAHAETPLWRVISSLPNPVEQLKDAEPAGQPVWESSFHIAHRINEHLQVGSVYFAGDAAHVHSPLGARGMNLGLEDAWVFAQLAASNQLARYGELRKRVDGRVVRRIEQISRMVVSDSIAMRLIRKLFAHWGLKIPLVRRQFMRTAGGLDHPLALR
ncbi:MAG TPA: FAD-dependent monooxygenase [Lacipirellulaceae bacterium]|nr:FAD-dependent monooxygenase [Lacipirellulaceae bacterium]